MDSTLPIEAQRDVFIDRFFNFVSGTFNLASIYIGDRLGLYRALTEGGPAAAKDLADRTHTHPRYIREWLEQQSVAGILQVDDERQDPDQRRYSLPDGHAEPMIDCQSLNYLAPLAQMIFGMTRILPEVVEAYRTGNGVPYSAFGSDMREAQAAINYPAFANEMHTAWLPKIPDVHARLQAAPPARVADIGCGYGWSTISIARGYPLIQVDGFDLDEPSIEMAKRNAIHSQVDDRVNFMVRDASDPALAGQYDLVTAFEALHDMQNPVGALRMMGNLAGGHGTVLIVDEKVGESFSVNGDSMDWLMYGYSILHCLPVGMGDSAPGTGTVMRQSTLENYARAAGFSKVEVLPIENMLFRFYRLHL